MGAHVVDVTIRDGGYEIGHHFTEEDIALVVSLLDAAGVKYIEVGHGMGVGTHKYVESIRPKERAPADDLAHIRTAKANAKQAKIGVLYGAGDMFCPADYLDEMKEAGLDFVRFACMPSDVIPKNIHYVERAKKLGLISSINCMQTYILPPAEIARMAKEWRSAGLDWWYVVDSAGGMQPAEIKEYVRAIREVTDIQIGLHAHNNLGLAVANSLAAVEAGATLIDGSLNGLGRATGNPPLEQLILSLQNMGHEQDLDISPALRLSKMYRVLFEDKGNNPMNFVSGASMLHSRNVPAVLAQAKQRGLSPADFMVKVGKEARTESVLDKWTFPDVVFERAAAASKKLMSEEATESFAESIAQRLRARKDVTLQQISEDLATRSARYHVPSVLHLVPADRFPFSGALPWQSATLVGVTVPWTEGMSPEALRAPSVVVVDASIAGTTGATKAPTLTCAWQDLWNDAIRAGVAAAGGEVVASADVASWIGSVKAGDRVFLSDRGPNSRRAADQIRAAGAHALSPPIALIIASRIQELISLSAAFGSAVAEPAAPWVDPILAPGEGQAVVDVNLGTIVEAGGHGWNELAATVAKARARTLANGTGKP